MRATAKATTESHVRAAIAQLVEEDNQLGAIERRQDARYPYFQPVTVISDNGNRSLSGITRQISPSGIGLLHCGPLGKGHASVTLHGDIGYAVTLSIEKVWCRPCGPYWYLSGGRFMDLAVAANSPMAVDDDARFDRSTVQLNQDISLFDEILHSVRQTINGVVDKPTFGTLNANRRSEERYYATLPVTVTPVDHKLRSINDGIRMVTRDISSRGLALFSDKPVNTKLLSLEITDRDGHKTLTALMQLLRCQPIGPVYEIAGKFVAKVFRD